MVDNNRVKVCADSLVGFREDQNAIYASLSAALKASTSGYYFNDLPGVDFEIVAAALSDDSIDANTYLTDVYEAELINIISLFVESNKSNGSSKELLSNQDLVSGIAQFKDKVVQNARFVGYLIKPHVSNNIESTITYLGFQATDTQPTDLRIYLYETSQNEAIATFNFQITKKLSLVWKEVSDFIVNYRSKDRGTGQCYYLGYYEVDPDNLQAFQLQSQALQAVFDCGCRGGLKVIWGKHIGVMPIEINNEDLNFNATSGEYDIPTPDNVEGNITAQTYGLLAKVNIKCVITELICDNISMFAKALQHAVAVRILFDAFASKRINSIDDSKREDSKNFAVHYKGILYGYTTEDGVKVEGILQLLTLDFSGLDKQCAPCKKDGVTFANLVR